MTSQEKLLQLFSDTEGLKKKLAGNIDYQRLGFDYNDILGFMDDKIVHVFMKYPDKPYEEVKAICLASLYNVKSRVYRKYGREVRDAEADMAVLPDYEPAPQFEHLFVTLGSLINSSQMIVAEVILNPPDFILTRITDLSKRVPSRLVLEYLGHPVNRANIKKLNKFRRLLLSLIRGNISPETLDLIPLKR